ncbi:MAG: hypothetical protein V4660_20560 [Pseudomonadota bacterium]
MGMHLVVANYSGMAGVLQVRNLQHDLNLALEQEDWLSVRRLDQACVVLIDKVIAANKDDSYDLILVLQELKDVYAGLISLCHHKVIAMAR